MNNEQILKNLVDEIATIAQEKNYEFELKKDRVKYTEEYVFEMSEKYKISKYFKPSIVSSDGNNITIGFEPIFSVDEIEDAEEYIEVLKLLDGITVKVDNMDIYTEGLDIDNRVVPDESDTVHLARIPNTIDNSIIHVVGYTLIGIIGGQLFEQAPNHQPRNAEKIMVSVVEAIRKDFDNPIKTLYTKDMTKSELYEWIDKTMQAIPEFRDLNLSQNELEQGVGVDDESRGKYKFTSIYDKVDENSWRDDFIDLTAFVQNVVYKYGLIKED